MTRQEAAAQIEKARQEQGIYKREVARRADLSYMSVMNVFNAKPKYGYKAFTKVVKALGIDLSFDDLVD